MNPGSKTFQSIVRHADFMVDHHRVHGLRIMPGVTFLDLIYRAAMAAGLPAEQLELRNILFPEPLAVTEEFDRKIEVCLRPWGERWQSVVRSRRTRGDRPLESAWAMHARSELELATNRSDEPIEVAALKACAREEMELEDLYAELRRLEIRHQEFMQPSGRVFRSDKYLLAELTLRELASPYASDFHLHPALLDCATGLSFFAGRAGGRYRDRPYIPIHIASFRAVKTLGDRCLVFIPAEQKEPSRHAEVARDRQIGIYSTTGEFLARFEGLTFKKVRRPDLILNLGQLHSSRVKSAPAKRGERAGKGDSLTAHTETAPANLSRGGLAEITGELKRRVAGELDLPPGQIDERAGFYELGLDSTQLLRLVSELEEQMGRHLYPTLFFEYPTIGELAAYLLKHHPEAVSQLVSRSGKAKPIVGAGEGEMSHQAASPGEELDFHFRWVETGPLKETSLIDAQPWLMAGEGPASQNIAVLVFDQTTQVLENCRVDLKNRGGTQIEFILVSPGARFAARNDGGYEINPAEPGDYRTLLKALSERGLSAGLVLSFWGYAGSWEGERPSEKPKRLKCGRFIPGNEPGGAPLAPSDGERAKGEGPKIASLEVSLVTSTPTGPSATVPREPVSGGSGDDLSAASVNAELRLGLNSVFALSQAWLESRNKSKLRVFVFHDTSAGPRPALAGIAGFAACLRRETPRVEVRLVGVDQRRPERAAIAAIVERELAAGEDAPEVRYTRERRYIRSPVPLLSDPIPSESAPAEKSPVLRAGGAYLITGGAGGLGQIFAEHLAREYHARLILVGRSDPGPAQAAQISALEKFGARAVYLRADVTEREGVTKAIGLAKQQFGPLHGVIHAAGILKDGWVVSAKARDLEAVLAPKVHGTLLLDEITKDEPLDFFALFSSLSGFIGTLGQSVYASANRFMDEFADWREVKRKLGRRSGRTVSLCWPLWAGGGMQGDDRLRDWLQKEFGIRPLESAAGLRAFARALGSDSTSFLVLSGDRARIWQGLKVRPEPLARAEGPALAGEGRGAPARAGRPKPGRPVRPEDIAIIGVSGRYPRSRDLDEFWQNLAGGRDCITEIPGERWDHRPYFNPAGPGPSQTKSKWGGFISDHDKFEPLLFNISPRDAELMDPQERLFLEVVWACLEDAGYTRKALLQARAGRAKNDVGVFVGVMWGDYQLLGEEGRLAGGMELASAYHWSIANRVSYCFNFNGPSLAVDSACSSSLAAIHLACESLRRGECRAAVAGGVNLSLHPSKYLLLSQSNMLSSDGRCRSFGEGGDGYVPGEGIGAILLKPVEAALEDRDHIHALVKGSALNHDGRASGYTVPNPHAQTRVIEEALERAGLDPRSISFLEAHGTGTSLGDPVEIAGLTRAFSRRTSDRQFCAVGSVKSVIGHLESAAGIAALTKVLLQLKHQKLAPSLHAARLNPNIDFANSPLRVQRELSEWVRPRLEVDGKMEEQPRRAGISSFGAGGTNVHLILEEFTPALEEQSGSVPMVLPLSAQNKDRLRAVARRLLDHLRSTDAPLTDCLYTLQVGRESLDERLALRAGNREEFVAGLESYLSGGRIDSVYAGRAKKHHISPVLIWVDDLRRIASSGVAPFCAQYRSFAAIFHSISERITAIRADVEVRPPGALANFAAQLSLALFLRELPVTIGACGGVGTGEILAAHLAGILDLNDAIVLVQSLESMSQPGAQPHDAEGRAGRNSLTELISRIQRHPPAADFYSSLLGRKSDGTDMDESYFQRLWGVGGEEGGWKRKAESRDLDSYEDEGGSESRDLDSYEGKGGSESRDLDSYEGKRASRVDLQPPVDRTWQTHFEDLLARLWVNGNDVDWPAFTQGSLRRIPLPTYPFAGKRYWLSGGQPKNNGPAVAGMEPSAAEAPAGRERSSAHDDRDGRMEQHVPISLWRPVWMERALTRPETAGLRQALLIFDDHAELHAYLLTVPGMERSILVKPGSTFQRLNACLFEIDPANPAHYERLLGTLFRDDKSPRSVVWRWGDEAWSMARIENGNFPPSTAGLDRLFHFSRALLGARPRESIRFIYLSDARGGPNPLDDAAASFLKCAQLEAPALRPQIVRSDSSSMAELGEMLAAELAASPTDREIDYRGVQRRVKELSRFGLESPGLIPALAPRLKPEGVYLITGGAGGIGLLLARHLAKRVRARLVLLGRTEMPKADSWERLRDDPSLTAEARRKAGQFAEIEKEGAALLYLRADVSQTDSLRAALAEARRHFGRLDGVVHAAGLIRDGSLAKKNKASFDAVLAPKIAGTVILDELTRGDRLGFFCLFSSSTAVWGNPGQSDYGAANGFMDSFARVREHWRARGLRHGKTVSINWPLWQEGGLRGDDLMTRSLSKHGLEPLPTPEAMRLFEAALGLLLPQVVVLAGDGESIAAELERRQQGRSGSAGMGASAKGPVGGTNSSSAEEFVDYLTGLVAGLLKIEDARVLDPDAAVAEYGMDSIVLKELVQRVNADCGDLLDPFVALQKNSIGALAGHLAEIGAALPLPGGQKNKAAAPPAPGGGGQHDSPADSAPQARRVAESPAVSGRGRMEEIAVIGMAGRFPQADNLDEYWRNIVESRRCIREIPAGRWPVPEHFLEGGPVRSKSYSKWGGFIDGIDLFDPEFFGLSESLAGVIDPLHRLFLEISARAFEHAGYRRESLRGQTGGVFVGARQGEYAAAAGLDLLLQADPANAWRYNSACMIARRVAECFDLRGPAYVVDTACSSSLVSVHLACESLRRDECDFAIAGGAELLLGPDIFIHFSQSGSLSPDGICRPFDSHANGTVLGEGGGAVVLKRLERALADGDNVLAIIKGSAMSNDGAATDAVGQVKAMKSVMRTVYQRSGVAPGEVGYLELHGEGSLLRDAVELRAVKEIQDEIPAGKAGLCPIGSVKAGIGHLLLASGIASFIKACLMVSRKGIPPHAPDTTMARYAGLSGGSFEFNREFREWKTRPGAARLIGINATGVAATNCFVLCSDSPHPRGKPSLSPRPMNKRRFWIGRPPDPRSAPGQETRPATTVGCVASRGASVPHTDEHLQMHAHSGATAWNGEESIASEVDQICAAILKRSGLDRDTNFFELGMDSFKILQLFRRIDEVFGVALDPTRLAEFSTMRGLAAYLARARGKTGPSAAKVLAAIEPGTNSLPAGGDDSNRGCDIDFGLYFFADYDRSTSAAKYRLLLDAVKFADAHGFSSVFTPERHFAEFGGIFPNPSVVSAALAAVTQQIHIRAGSVVSPLHDPLRIAEEWSVVDNLSNGRAAISFTYGWQCDDFVLRPDGYLDRHAEMFRQIEMVKRLWRGEAIRRVNGLGKEIEVRIYPEPIQRELPVWVTCAISRESFVNAGKIGANIVTFLLGQGINDLTEKIALYRESLQANGFDPAQGRVSLMVHTFIGDDLEQIKKTIRQPFLKFIRSQAQLARNLVQSLDPAQDIDDPKSLDELMDIGFERFFGNSGLLGTLTTCAEAVKKFKEMGVDELSCLIDFGLNYETVMGGLPQLARLKSAFPPSRKPRSVTPETARGLAGSAGDRRCGSPSPGAPGPVEAVLSSEGAFPRSISSGAGANEAARPSLFDRLERFRSFLPGGTNVPGRTDPNLMAGGNGAGRSNGSDSGNGSDSSKRDAGAAAPAELGLNGGVAAEAAAESALRPASEPDLKIGAVPASAQEPFPLTAVQQAYWMGRNPRFELGATSTHGYAELVVSLDLRRFQAALQRVVDRHPMLRAVVLSGREQRVLPGNPQYHMKVVDLRPLSDRAREEALEVERRTQSHRIFRPDEWPLFDFHAFILTEREQYLTFGFDSLIADAASVALIFREIMHYYHHPDESLPELPFTFRDYLLAYHQFRTSETYQQDKDYWLSQIDSFHRAPAVPLKKAVGAVGQPQFRRQAGLVKEAVWQRLKSAARQNMVTPTVLLFTAFARLLTEWSGQQQFTLNLTVFNRLPFHPLVGQIVGDFTSLLLVKIDARPCDFWEHAREIQAEVFSALQHRHFDGVDVIKELGRRRNLLGKAIVPIVFTSNLLNSEEGADGLSQLGKIVYMITQTTQAYLDNQVAETRDGLSIAWDYIEELFEPKTIQEMFARYVDQLEQLVPSSPAPAADPRPRTLADFVDHYNSTDDPSLEAATLHELFGRQAERTPDLEAVRFGSESLSYRELEARSNQVARLLQFRGIGPRDLVGLLAPRAISTIIQALGILKAGAAYVPMEPEYPAARRQLIADKSRCKTVLGERALIEAQGFAADPVPSRSGPDDLAYVIFTSGSTGEPKGVMINHRAAANTVLDMNRRYGLGPGDRVLGISSFCFDLSVYDLFGSLAAGATLVLIKDIHDPKWMARVVREEKITVWNSVPTLLRLMIEHVAADYAAESVRLVLLSGDWIPVSLPARARTIFPRSSIVGLGGATEASIWSILYPIADVDPAWRTIPYGYPMKNQKWYVLDDKMQICPVGQRGELYIGGAGLSQGYLHDPEKTAAAFIHHREWGPLYRTGDWGVWREPGYIEFLGRQDQQIKIRGFRVELGEIESQLRRHPAIEEAVVLPTVDEKGDKSLCAYLVPKRGGPPLI